MQGIRDWIQFIASVASPFMMIWVGFVSTEIHTRVKEQREIQEKAIARQDQIQKETFARQDQLQKEALTRQDELQREAFAASGTRFDHTKNLFNDLLSTQKEQKRLAVLSTLAFIHERQIPEFFLPILAITEAKDADISGYLRQGLKELTLAEGAPPSMRSTATRALALLITPDDLAKLQRGEGDDISRANLQAVQDTATSLTNQSAAALKPEEKKQVQKQLQELAPTVAAVAVAAPDPATKAQAAATLEKTPVNRTSVEQAVANVTAKFSSEAQTTITPRVYLRIQDEKQRTRAEDLKQTLIRSGNLVPGIELASGSGGTSSDRVEIRYFDQASQPQAEALLNLLKSKGFNGQIALAAASADQAPNSTNMKTEFEILAGKDSFR